MALSYKEIEAKYNLEEAYISMAVIRNNIKPVGCKTNEKGRRVKSWNEVEVVKAVADLFREKAYAHIEKANMWRGLSDHLMGEVSVDVVNV